MPYFQVTDQCNGCLACVQNCPANALMARDEKGKRTLLHNMALCARCGTCWRVCPQEAILFEHFLENKWDEIVQLDLVYCHVCREPLYTANFNQTLTDRTKKPAEPTCPRHRLSLDLMARAYFFPGNARPHSDKAAPAKGESK